MAAGNHEPRCGQQAHQRRRHLSIGGRRWRCLSGSRSWPIGGRARGGGRSGSLVCQPQRSRPGRPADTVYRNR